MGFFLQNAWLIPLFPLLSFVIITLTYRIHQRCPITLSFENRESRSSRRGR